MLPVRITADVGAARELVIELSLKMPGAFQTVSKGSVVVLNTEPDTTWDGLVLQAGPSEVVESMLFKFCLSLRLIPPITPPTIAPITVKTTRPITTAPFFVCQKG